MNNMSMATRTRSRRLCVYIVLDDADEKMATVTLMADNDNNSREKPLLFSSSPMYVPLKGIHSVNTNNNNDSRRVQCACVCVCLTQHSEFEWESI